MASRSPNGAGLVVAPTEPQELQVHRYWGRYATAATLPNVASGLNTLSAPGFEKLRRGDVAVVDDNLDTGNVSMYICTQVGTAGGDDTVWTMLSASATTRDAHVYVVGNSQGSPLGTGDTAALVDYLDTGDGAQLEQSLTDAAANFAGLKIDIRVRPGTYDLSVAAVAELVVPSNVNLIGAGRDGNTAVIVGDGRLVSLTSGSGLHDIHLSQNGDGAAGETSILRIGNNTVAANIRVRNVRLDTLQALLTNTIQAIGTDSAAITGDIDIEDIAIDASSVDSGQTFRGVVLGEAVASTPTRGPQVRNVKMLGGSTLAGEFNIYPTASPSNYENLEHANAQVGATAEPIFGIVSSSAAPSAVDWNGPRLRNLRISIAAGEAFGGTPIEITHGNDGAGNMIDFSFDGITLSLGAGASLTADGMLIECSSDSSIQSGSIQNVRLPTMTDDGIHLRVNDAASITGSMEGIRMSDIRIAGGPKTRAIHFEDGQGAGALGQINACSIMNSYIPGGSTASVDIDTGATPAITNTHVGFNYMIAQGPTALRDTGSGTESAHNIL